MKFDISDIGTWAGSLSLLAWIVYIILKESIKNKFARELEGFKAGYQKVLDENQIRFSKWHDAQAEAIKELYFLLIIARDHIEILNNHCCSSVLKKDEYGTIIPSDLNPNDLKLFDNAEKASHDFNNFFQRNAILFDDMTYDKVNQLFKTSRSIIVDRTHDGSFKNIKKAMNDFKDQLCPIIDELRKDFRAILNGEEVQDAE